MSAPRPTIRVDKWLWHARFFKTRTLAAKQVAAGAVRVNGVKIAKSSVTVGPGDTLTFAQARDIRVIEIADIGARRGPAPEAQQLYFDRSPPPEPKPDYVPPAPGYEGKGRPTKKTRRTLDLSRRSHLE